MCGNTTNFDPLTMCKTYIIDALRLHLKARNITYKVHHFSSPATHKFGQQVTGLLTGLCFSISAAAQIVPAQERDIGARNQQELQRQQQQEQQQRQQRERTPDVRLTAPEKATTQTLPIETPCFPIQRLQLQNSSGVSLPEFDWVVEQLTAPDAPVFIGQCVGARGVAWLIERTQKILVDRGFVTSRVLATQQDMSQGSLALTLIPGRIRAIRLAQPVDPRVNLSNALPIKAGDILNLRDIEQALENLKRVPTAEADIQIEPSQGEGTHLGDSDLVVSYRQSFPLRLSVNADDSGTKATGRYQGSVTVSYDNALTLNDLFYITNTNGLGGGDSGPRGTHANTIHYSLPFGYWTLGATSSTSTYYQTVAGLNQSYVYRGTSENNDIKLNRLLLRDGSQKLNLAVRAFQRKSNNYIDDTEVNVQRRVVGGWDSTLNHKVFIQDATLESNLTYKRGTGAFGSIPAPEEAFNEGTSRFALVVADVNLAIPFKVDDQRIRYNGSWRIQKNRTSLTPQDRFVIGGRYTVRGYDGESVLSAERGWFWRNDLSFSLSDSGQEFYAGLDTGQVGGPSSELLVATRLTGAVLGLRGSIQKLNYDIFVGAPVNKPENFKTAGSTAGFSLSVSF
jgi:hemolysin activation/secretion protein